MIEKISKKICCFALNNSMLSDKKYTDIYQYGIEIMISSIIGVMLIILSGVIIKDMKSAIMFLISFMLLRSFCGGYHANNYLKCNIIFIVLFS